MKEIMFVDHQKVLNKLAFGPSTWYSAMRN